MGKHMCVIEERNIAHTPNSGMDESHALRACLKIQNSLRRPPCHHDRLQCLLLSRPRYPLTMTAR
jgi:hypothetical protein